MKNLARFISIIVSLLAGIKFAISPLTLLSFLQFLVIAAVAGILLGKAGRTETPQVKSSN